MSIIDELKSKKFSIYGQWVGIINIFLCIALGIANMFHLNLVILFSVFSLVQGLCLIFVEVPFLLRICPLSDRFIAFMNKFNANWPRAAYYAVNAVIQYLSLFAATTSLLAVAILFTIGAILYILAALTGQEFEGSPTLGGATIPGQIGQHVGHEQVRNLF